MAKLNLKEQIYNAILNNIDEGVYPPGEILNEKTLMEKYHCSKSPVREALIALCTDKVLKNLPRFGYEVTYLTENDIYQMLEFRLALECGILTRKLASIGKPEIQKLTELNEQCLREDLSPREHWEANSLFHETLISFCGNSYVTEQLSATLKRLTRAYAQTRWNKQIPSVYLPNDCKHHKNILEALERKNAGQLKRALEADLQDFKIM